MRFLEFSSLFDIMQAFPTEESCVVYLEKLRWGGAPVSPFDATAKVYKCKSGKYKCGKTLNYFNVRTGTIFQDSRMPLRKWIMAIYLFTTHKKGISSHQLARDLSITQKTAWFVLHRLRFAMSQGSMWDYFDSGVVEVDETYIGGKTTNKHQQGKERGDFMNRINFNPVKDKSIVFGIVQRGGDVYMKQVPKASKKVLVPIIKEKISSEVTIISDEHVAYGLLNQSYSHATVHHADREYVRGEVHTNTIEGVWSQLKRGIYGIYHQTSEKHLQAYCSEFAFRYNIRKFSEYQKVNACLNRTSLGTLKYKTLIANK